MKELHLCCLHRGEEITCGSLSAAPRGDNFAPCPWPKGDQLSRKFVAIGNNTKFTDIDESRHLAIVTIVFAGGAPFESRPVHRLS
jgi:hypothetical protein